jgi:hypothetical protein
MIDQPNPHPEPPTNFNEIKLPISYLDRLVYRLNPVNYDSAIYYDRSGCGRFENSNVGVLYLGETIESAFIETFGRRLGVRYVSRQFVKTRNLFAIRCDRSLKLVDLFGAGLVKLGADSEISSGRNYRLAQNWSAAIYHHPQQVDGIRYLSRHDNTQLCWGLFPRSDYQLEEQNLGSLIDYNQQKFLEILNRYEFGSD